VAERTGDSSQPGSWIYSVLPYIEEKDLRNSVTGATAASAGAAYAKLVTASIPVTSCPSRRKSQTLYIPTAPTTLRSMTVATGTLTLSTAVRSDYAINSGTSGACVPVATYKGTFQSLKASSYNSKKVSLCHKGKTQSIGLPAVTAVGHEDDTLGPCESCNAPFSASNMHKFATLADGDQWRKMSLKDKILTDLTDLGIPDTQDGISFRMSRLQPASIFDGLSNTYLIGEKYVMAGKYDVGTDDGDCRPMMVGYSHDNVRWAIDPPAADTRQVSRPTVFGSAHRGGWNVAYADGAVRTVDFDIDPTLHRQLASRDNISRGGMAGIPSK
jgi:hypothetical protein